MIFKSFTAAAALACATFAAPALAQDAGADAAAGSGVTVGATVYGPQGGVVGTVKRVAGDNVVLDTGTMEATVPASSLGAGENGPTIGWTKADLEAAILAAQQDAAAALDAALTAGTSLYSLDGIVVGTVTEVNPEGMVVVEHTSAGPIQLPKDQMRLQNGNLTLLVNAADLAAAVSAQTGAAPAATADAAATTQTEAGL